jgi:hypothetical protein
MDSRALKVVALEEHSFSSTPRGLRPAWAKDGGTFGTPKAAAADADAGSAGESEFASLSGPGALPINSGNGPKATRQRRLAASISPQLQAPTQHEKKIKENRNRNASLVCSRGQGKLFDLWSSVPTWSPSSCDLILRELAAAEHRHSPNIDVCPDQSCCQRPFCCIDVNGHPWDVVHDLPILEKGLFAEGHDTYMAQKVVREMIKGITDRNQESLYQRWKQPDAFRKPGVDTGEASEATSTQMVPLVLADKEEKGQNLLKTFRSSSECTIDKLRVLARAANCATTDVGKLLSGRKAMRQAVAAFHDDDEQKNTVLEHGLSEEDDLRRQQWAELAVSVSDQDKIRGVAANKVSRAQCLQRGKLGEMELEKALAEAGVHREDYWSEAETLEREEAATAAGERCTPDVLFKKAVTIQGREVKWIDAKYKLLIPSVSFTREVADYDKQMAKYVARYGPGAVLWGPMGFCASLVDRHDQVAHFTVTQKKNSTRRCVKKKEGKGGQPPAATAGSTVMRQVQGQHHTPVGRSLSGEDAMRVVECKPESAVTVVGTSAVRSVFQERGAENPTKTKKEKRGVADLVTLAISLVQKALVGSAVFSFRTDVNSGYRSS